MTQNSEAHIRSAPKLHLTDTDIGTFRASMTPLMALQLAQHLGMRHVDTANQGEWYAEAYQDAHDVVAPFKMVLCNDKQGWVECHEEDMEFIANACTNDVWAQKNAPDNLITAYVV